MTLFGGGLNINALLGACGLPRVDDDDVADGACCSGGPDTPMSRGVGCSSVPAAAAIAHFSTMVESGKVSSSIPDPIAAAEEGEPSRLSELRSLPLPSGDVETVAATLEIGLADPVLARVALKARCSLWHPCEQPCVKDRAVYCRRCTSSPPRATTLNTKQGGSSWVMQAHARFSHARGATYAPRRHSGNVLQAVPLLMKMHLSDVQVQEQGQLPPSPWQVLGGGTQLTAVVWCGRLHCVLESGT